MATIVDVPWQLTTSEDGMWEVAEANCKVPPIAALLRPYFGAVAKAAAHDLAGEWRHVCVPGAGWMGGFSDCSDCCACVMKHPPCTQSPRAPSCCILCPAVHTEWAKVMHMLAPPTAFFSPRMLLAALRYGLAAPLLARLPGVGRRFK